MTFLAEVVGCPGLCVVLKLFKSDIELGRRQREIDVLTVLNDQRIVHISDILYDETNGDPVGMVLEYVAGRTLSNFLKEKPDIQELLRIFGEVLKAVEVAHAEGIYHHDLKPGNIMIGEDGRVVLIDFGLAYMIGSQPITDAGCLMGTPTSMPPEMLSVRPNSRDSPAGDIYGLGVMLYELLTGRKYRTRSAEVVKDVGMMGRRRGHIASCFGNSPEGDAVEALVAHMVNRVENDRPRSILDIKTSFERLNQALLAAAYIPDMRNRDPEIPRDTPTLMEAPLSRPSVSSPPEPSLPPMSESLPPRSCWSFFPSSLLPFHIPVLLLLLASLLMGVTIYVLR